MNWIFPFVDSYLRHRQSLLSTKMHINEKIIYKSCLYIYYIYLLQFLLLWIIKKFLQWGLLLCITPKTLIESQIKNGVESKAWDWDSRFVSISRQSQFVSNSDWLFITYKLKHSNFILFESILGIITILTIKKYWYFTLLKTFRNWYLFIHYFLSIMNVSYGNLKTFLINFEH